MNKTSSIFIGIGAVILVAVIYFVFSYSPQKQIETQTINQQNIEERIDYKTGSDVKVIKVKQGQEVSIKITSDTADEAHFHGYDISVEVKQGSEAVLNFNADKTGRFTLELEKLGKEIGVVEVYP